MAIDPVWIWIALGVVGLLVVAGLFARGVRRSRTEALREKFGPEYDYAVKEKGWKRGERDLVTRVREVEQAPIRALNADERTRFRREWNLIEQHFIERPTTAVVQADELVAEIMRLEGYPMGDFEKHASDLSVRHPRVVHHYRSGHKIMAGAAGSASTEDLRQAMLHYRALFEELAGERAGDVVQDVPRENEVVTPPRRTMRDDRVVDEPERRG